jgi:CRP-like cAMP-binding protein
MEHSAVEMSSRIAPLDRVGWLATQPAELRAWVARVGRWRRFEAGQLIYDAGDTADGLYGLAEGALNVTFPFVRDEPVALHRAEVGFWVGDAALLADAPRLVSLSAALPSRVLFVPGHALSDLLARQPAFWRSFYELSHGNFALTLDLLAESLVLSPRARIARQLLRLADGSGVAPVGQEDLARVIGVTRTTLYRAMREFTEAGALATGYRHITILDRAALERAAAED